MRRIVQQPAALHLGEDVGACVHPRMAMYDQTFAIAQRQCGAAAVVHRRAAAPPRTRAMRAAEHCGDPGGGHERAPAFGLIGSAVDCRPAAIQASISSSAYKIRRPTR